MLIVGILFLFFENFLVANDFCEVKNIEKFDYKLFNCIDSQLLFGYLEFRSKDNNFVYIENNHHNIKIISKYYDEMIDFINAVCLLDKKIRIKDVTNYDKLNADFSTTIILSCTSTRK
tara:strand:- start:242 stop:595 length:354 start_codon:yes stop_codon:yes gene_type:complete